MYFLSFFQAIFNKRDPIVLGVTVETGILRTTTPLCVPSKEVTLLFEHGYLIVLFVLHNILPLF